mgnify:CR=1 FL=1
MALSSIFANVRITDPRQAEDFAEALDVSAMDSVKMPSASMIPLVTNIEEIREFMADEGNDESEGCE